MKKSMTITVLSLAITTFICNYSLQANTNINSSRRIVFQKMIDLDGDKKVEKIVFDVDKSYDGQSPEEYSRVLIYRIQNHKELLAFSAVIYGWHIDKNHLFILEDRNKNGVPEIYLSEFWNDSSPDRISIIEKVAGKYYLVFQRPIDKIQYQDFDKDGALEIYGLTGSTTGEMLFDREEIVFKFVKSKYYPSYKLTWELYNERQKKAEQAYQKNPEDNFFYLLTLTACIGLQEKGMSIIEDYKNKGYDINVQSVTKAFKSKVGQYAQWWKELNDDSRD